MATGFLTMLLSRPDIYSVVAEGHGKITLVLDEHDDVHRIHAAIK